MEMKPKKVVVQRMDGGLGVVLPPEVVERMRIGDGDELYASEAEDGILLSTRDPSFDRAMTLYRRGADGYRNALRELGS
jgi:putative addiction module antidote